MASSKKVHAIGIDLGTTYSCVGVWHHGHVKVIANDQGNRITPSCVAFTSDLRLIGEAARNQADRNPTNTIFGIKRLIGRRFSDKTVESDRKLWPFDVIQGRGDKPKIVVQYKEKEKQFLPEELSAIILEKMKKIAENFLECKGKDVVINAVITVPAYFNDSQRRATMVAGNIAGLNVMRIIDEPTAAAVAYGFEKLTYVREKKNVLVFDLGGGTFDVSVLNINKGVFEVKATAGDTHLGGEDFDNRLLIHFIDQIKKKHKKDIIDNPKSIRRLRSACEQAKKNISFEISTTVDVPGLYDGTDFTLNITRAQFEDLNMDLFERCMGLVTKCLEDAHMEKTAIDVVVLVGGSTRIPKVKKMLQDLFDGKELCKSINPDEAVAYGATVQAAKLSSQGNQEILDMVLLDVTPLSLGINLIGGIMSVVVPRNTVIPTIMWSGFTPSMDNQTVVKFEVFEGERAQTKDNYRLGEFSLSGITLAPRGVTNLDVCFEIDANGILNVSAQDRSNGRKNQITVTHEEDSLNDYQIKDIIRDAEMYKAHDEECRRSYEARLSLEVYACSMKNAMKNKRITDTLPCATKIRIEDAIKETLSWVDDNSLPDVVESKSRMEKLKSICAPIDCI